MSKENKRISIGLITLVASLGGFLFGFDIVVISGVLPFIVKQYTLSAGAQGWFTASALIGCIVGVVISGELSDRFGRRNPLLISALLFTLSSIGCVLIPSFGGVISARIMGGIGIGIASNVVPLYISEIAPSRIRGRLVTYYQFALTFGILMAFISNALLVKAAGPSGTLYGFDIWKVMLGVGVFPALLFLFGLFAVPESPRWLLHNGRKAEGEDILKRIGGGSDIAAFENADSTPVEQVSYSKLFAPGIRRAMIICILLPLFSQFSGVNVIFYYGPKILANAGVSLDDSLLSQIILGGANMIFTLIAIWKVDSWGRRPLYLIGTAGATVTLIATGAFFYYGQTTSIWLLFCVIAFLAFFSFSIGPLKFVVASEIFPSAIRGRALAISIMVMWVADAVVAKYTPQLLDDPRIGTAGTFWLFAFFCVLAFISVYKLLPETRGKSLEEIEKYWKDRGIEVDKDSFKKDDVILH